MRRSGEKLRLGAFFNPTGHHVASWRHPQSQADAGVNFDHYVEIARTAERAKMDMVFLADNISVREAHPEALVSYANFPSTEYLTIDFTDFVSFNVYLHDEAAFRR